MFYVLDHTILKEYARHRGPTDSDFSPGYSYNNMIAKMP